MILNKLVTVLVGKKELKNKLQFSTIQDSPYRFTNRRNLRNRGL